MGLQMFDLKNNRHQKMNAINAPNRDVFQNKQAGKRGYLLQAQQQQHVTCTNHKTAGSDDTLYDSARCSKPETPRKEPRKERRTMTWLVKRAKQFAPRFSVGMQFRCGISRVTAAALHHSVFDLGAQCRAVLSPFHGEVFILTMTAR
ncbi:MAG: hypothetical protein U0996_14815 [Planctomycetaceae bacterium]